MLRELGAERDEVRTPAELEGLDGLVIPGGESTTIAKGIESAGLEPAIRAHHEAGRPIFGTCAGMIVCDDAHLGLIDVTAERNAFGRQLQSFEADLEVEGIGDEPLRAVFIRAPWVEQARRRGRGARLLRGPSGGDPRRRRARLRLSPRADRRPAAARAVHGNDDRRRASARARRRRRERPEGGEPGEDPGRLLDQGGGGGRRLDRRRERGRAAAARASTRRC